ncbi:MAG: acyltransferase family protein [Rhodocyclaceae bacterium]
MHSELLESDDSLVRTRASHKASPSLRYKFVDNAKAVGIVLVLLGHSKGMPAGLLNMIYGFHMPLFFFLSGYLLKPERLADSPRQAGERLLRTLGVPYVFFFVLSYVYWLITRDIGYKAEKFEHVPWYDPFTGLISGLGGDLYVNPPLWFFPCLLLTALAYHLSRSVLSARNAVVGMTAVAALVCLWANDPAYRLPWGLDVMWVALAFYAAGHYLRDHMVALARLIKAGVPLWVAILVGWVLLSVVNGHADLAEMRFGSEPLLYIPVAVLGIVMVLIGAHLMPALRITRWLSDNTLIIFPTHMLVFSVINGAASATRLVPVNQQYEVLWGLSVTATTLLLSVPVVYLLRRSVPAMLGRSA